MPEALPRWPQRYSCGIWSPRRETHLVGAVEFQFTGADRTVHTQVVRASEPVSAELPGNLATAAGSLLRRLVSEGVTHIVGELKQDLRRGETPQ